MNEQERTDLSYLRGQFDEYRQQNDERTRQNVEHFNGRFDRLEKQHTEMRELVIGVKKGVEEVHSTTLLNSEKIEEIDKRVSPVVTAHGRVAYVWQRMPGWLKYGVSIGAAIAGIGAAIGWWGT